MQSLATALRRPDGERRGRASLRLALVVVLIAVQSIEVSESAPLLFALHLWALPSLCLAGLGASLGFGAAQHRAAATWREVAGDRMRLALPVYAFAIVAAVFVLGLALSTAGPAGYLRDGRTFSYLLNLVGVAQYELPGVFEFNNIPRTVNAVVWVAPLYLALLAVACLPPTRRGAGAVPAGLAVALALAALVVQGIDPEWVDASDLAALVLRGDGLSLMLGGLLGMAIFAARGRVPIGVVPAIGAAAIVGAAALVGNPGWLAAAAFRVVVAVPTVYLATFLTVRRLPLPALSRRAEPLLAGLFLFAYPLQQAMVERGPERQGFLVNLALAGSAALVLAIGFWRLVGRRLLSPRMRAALVATATADREPLFDLRRVRRIRRGAVIESLAITLVIGGLFIGVMAMIYIAFLPQ